MVTVRGDGVKGSHESVNKRAPGMTSSKTSTTDVRSSKEKTKSNVMASKTKTVAELKQVTHKTTGKEATTSLSRQRTDVPAAVAKDKAKPVMAAKQKASSSSTKVALKRTESVPSKSSPVTQVTHRSGSLVKVESKRSDKSVTSSMVSRATTRSVSGPMKASHSVKVPTQVSSNSPQMHAKPTANAAVVPVKNVMNQVHNVTVTSPPPVRRNLIPVAEEAIETVYNPISDHSVHRRSRTRTLDKDEIVFLRNERALAQAEMRTDIVPSAHVTVEVKQPIAFEVNFDDGRHKSQSETQSVTEHIDTANKSTANDEDDDDDIDDDENYDDDFDSYESDFESASATSSDGDASSTTSNSSSAMAAESSDTDDNVNTESRKSSGQQQMTPNQSLPYSRGITEEERQLDSGAFELKPSHNSGQSRGSVHLVDDILSSDERYTSSEAQNDSGIEYYHNTKSPTFTETAKSTIADDNAQQRSIKQSEFYRRGNELMSKITLDTMNYVLFDFKPIAYEHFMRLYGNSNAVQTLSQTHNNHIHQEVQTEMVATVTAWTQFPINYSVEHITQPDGGSYARGYGCADVDDHPANPQTGKHFEQSVLELNRYDSNSKSSATQLTMPIDGINDINHAALNRFLQESLVTISGLIAGDRNTNNVQSTSISVATRPLHFPSASQLNQSKAIQLHGQNNLTNFLFTLHRHEADQLNVIAVWNVCDASQPICILSSWCNVICFVVHANMRGVVIGGLEDGYDGTKNKWK